MALTECRECGHEISSSAVACPQCGAKPYNASPGCAKILIIVIMIIVFAMFMTGLNHPDNRISQPDLYPTEPASSAKDDAIAFYKHVTSVTLPCDWAGGVRTVAMLGSDSITIYQATQKEVSACSTVVDQLEELQIPKSLGQAVERAFADAIEGCKSAYLSQWSAANSLSEALDNGGKLGDLARYKDSKAASHVKLTECYNSLISAPASLGVSRDDLEGYQERARTGDSTISPPVTDTSVLPDSTNETEPIATANLTDYSFDDFRSKSYSGPWVAPNFSGAQRPFRSYRTVIRDAVKRGPSFAGRVAIAEFGCGTDCGMGYAVDLANGNVFDLPVGGDATVGMQLEYHLGSRLLKAAWTGGSRNPACAGFGYFEWTDAGFETLKRSAPPPPECQ